MVIDLVCGMIVDEKSSPATIYFDPSEVGVRDFIVTLKESRQPSE